MRRERKEGERRVAGDSPSLQVPECPLCQGVDIRGSNAFEEMWPVSADPRNPVGDSVITPAFAAQGQIVELTVCSFFSRGVYSASFSWVTPPPLRDISD